MSSMMSSYYEQLCTQLYMYQVVTGTWVVEFSLKRSTKFVLYFCGEYRQSHSDFYGFQFSTFGTNVYFIRAYSWAPRTSYARRARKNAHPRWGLRFWARPYDNQGWNTPRFRHQPLRRLIDNSAGRVLSEAQAEPAPD